MLKWTVISRRDPTGNSVESRPLPPNCTVTPTPRSKSKRRRSSTTAVRRISATAVRRNSTASASHHRRSSALRRNSLDELDADKENQYTSTPIKSSTESNFLPFEALRDVSNLTPTMKEMNREQVSTSWRVAMRRWEKRSTVKLLNYNGIWNIIKQTFVPEKIRKVLNHSNKLHA